MWASVSGWEAEAEAEAEAEEVSALDSISLTSLINLRLNKFFRVCACVCVFVGVFVFSVFKSVLKQLQAFQCDNSNVTYMRHILYYINQLK